ncbi:IS3 family transposase [Enterococcus timonensis]|uniref:IS3 family transposase n=1 Tax=Enterococcus timonensis TaxID=1852364 RepID=UPI0038B2B15B
MPPAIFFYYSTLFDSRFKTLQQNPFTSFEELKQTIIKWIDYYNTKRIKQKLDWLSPTEYRLKMIQ